MALPENAHRRGSVSKNAATVRHAAKKDSAADGQPAAYRPLCHPRWSEKRRRHRKKANATRAAATCFRETHDECDCNRDEQPAAGHSEENCRRQNRELSKETPWPGNLVISLANTLRPEMSRGRWAPQHVNVRPNDLPAPGRSHGAHQLEILEHCAPVVTISGSEDRPPHSERSRPVSSGNSIEERSSGVPHRIKRKRREIVLWPHNVGGAKRILNRRQRRSVIPNVVIGDDDCLVRRKTNAREHSPDLAHGSSELRVWPHMQCRRAKGGRMSIENLCGRAVDDNRLDTGNGRQPSHIFRQLGAGKGR